jgi:signal recognition particle subunit SEC65
MSKKQLPQPEQNFFLTKEFVLDTFPKQTHLRLNAVTAMLDSWSALIWPHIQTASPTPELNSLKDQLQRAKLKIQQADKMRPQDHFEGRGTVGVEVSKYLRMTTIAQPHSIQNERLNYEFLQLFVYPIEEFSAEELDKIGQDLLLLCKRAHSVSVDLGLDEQLNDAGIIAEDRIFNSKTPLLYLRGTSPQHDLEGVQTNIEPATYALYSSAAGHFKIVINHPIEGPIDVNTAFFLEGMLLDIVYGLWLMYSEFRRITANDTDMLGDYSELENKWKDDFLQETKSKAVMECLIDTHEE